MNLERWRKLGEWHDSFLEALARALPDADAESNTETLLALRAQLLEALERLRAGLLPELADKEVNQLLLPLVLLSDEKVLARLRSGDRRLWPLLQKELYGLENGGDLFYELADELLAAGVDPVHVREVLLFCLQDGFRGKHAESPARLLTYRTKLAATLEQPILSGTLTPEPTPEMLHLARGSEATSRLFKGVVFPVTAALVLAMPLLFVWLSNFFTVKE